MIPKPGGAAFRPLGIPTIRYRVAQTAAKLMLAPIFESDFKGKRSVSLSITRKSLAFC
jgi:RNA-directed DNA polymerase